MCNAIVRNGPKQGKTLKLSSGKGKSSRLRKAYLLTKNICPD